MKPEIKKMKNILKVLMAASLLFTVSAFAQTVDHKSKFHALEGKWNMQCAVQNDNSSKGIVRIYDSWYATTKSVNLVFTENENGFYLVGVNQESPNGRGALWILNFTLFSYTKTDSSDNYWRSSVSHKSISNKNHFCDTGLPQAKNDPIVWLECKQAYHINTSTRTLNIVDDSHITYELNYAFGNPPAQNNIKCALSR